MLFQKVLITIANLLAIGFNLLVNSYILVQGVLYSSHIIGISTTVRDTGRLKWGKLRNLEFINMLFVSINLEI